MAKTNKQFEFDKKTQEYCCVNCDFRTINRAEICRHNFKEKKESGKLTKWDLHRYFIS